MMRITVSGRRMDISDALRSYTDSKASKLERYYDRVQRVDIVFDREASNHRCEVIARADHHAVFVAKEEHEDPYASLDAAVKDLERQLSRHKEKFRNRKHLTGRQDRKPMSGPEPEDTSSDEQTEGEAS